MSVLGVGSTIRERMSLVWKIIQSKLDNFRVCFIIISFLAVGYRVLTLVNLDFNGYNEQIFNVFVKNLGENGIEGIRLLIREYPVNEILVKGPAPFRILYVLAGLLVSKLRGNYSIVNLGLVSFVSGISTIIISFILLRKWFSLNVVFLATLLIIISPISTALSRRALEDSLFTFFVIMSYYFYHQSWIRKKIIDLFILGLTVLCGFLTKESMLFLYPSFIIAAIYYKKNISNNSLFRLAIPLLIAPLLYLFISLWIAGNFYGYFNTYVAFLKGQFNNNYVIKFQQGPWFRYVIDFFLLSPLTYLFSVVGMATYLVNKSDRDARNLCIIYVLSGFAVFSLLHSFNIRFVLFLDVILRVLSALGIISIIKNINQKVYRYLFATVLIFIIFSVDIYQFFQIFVKAKIYDPVTLVLIYANGFIK